MYFLYQYLWVFVPVILVPLFMKTRLNKHEFTKFECLFTVIVSVAVSGGMMWVFVWGSMNNTEVLESRIVGKHREIVSCEHSYESCSGSGDSRSCVTLFEHDHDYDWVLDIDDRVMGNIKIDRVDSQGKMEPELYTDAQIGGIAFKNHSYVDYIKANKNSLFNHRAEADALKDDVVFKTLPNAPKIYDQYQYNRVIVLNKNGKNKWIRDHSKGWRLAFDSDLKTISSKIQANVIVVVSNVLDDSLYHKIIVKWNGGSKNDIILFYNVNEDGVVNWFRSTSFMDGFENNTMHSLLRLNTLGKHFDASLYGKTMGIIKNNFHRHDMEKEKAQLDSYSVPWWVIAACLFVGCFSGVLLSKQLEKHDISMCAGGAFEVFGGRIFSILSGFGSSN